MKRTIHQSHFKGEKMKVVEVEVGMTDSIKLDNYQYVKPELRVKVVLDEDDDYDEVVDKVHSYIRKKLKIFKDERLKDK